MTVQEIVIECVRIILDNPSADVRWYDRTNEWVEDSAHVEITVLSIPRVGVDEKRTSPEGATNVRERIYGNRTLKLQIVCNTSDQDLLDSGQELADQIGTGFNRSDVSDLLASVDLGVPRSTPVRAINAPDAHGDQRSIGAIELWFPWSRSQRGGLLGTIGTIAYTGDVDETPIVGTVTE